MPKKQFANSFEGGLNTDVAPEAQPAQTYVDAQNLRTVSLKGENGKVQNIESHTLYWPIPERIPRLDKVEQCYTITGGNPIVTVILALAANGGAEIDRYTATGQNLVEQIVAHYNGLEIDVNGTSYRIRARPSTPTCVLFEVSNVREDTDINQRGVAMLIAAGNQNDVTVTTTDRSIPEVTDVVVVGMASQANTLIVVTNGLQEGNPTLPRVGSIWKIESQPGDNDFPYPVGGAVADCYSQLRYHGFLNLENDRPLIDAYYVEVNDCNHIFTWTDDKNEPSTVELSRVGLNLTPPNALRDRGLVDYCPYVDFVGYTDGKLRVGLWQYAVQLVTKDGNTTNYGPETYPVMVRASNSKPYYESDGRLLGEPGTVGVRLRVKNLDGQYDRFRVVAMYTSQEDGPPTKPEIIADREFNATEVEVLHKEEGGPFGTLDDVSLVTQRQPYITRAKRMALVNQTKIIANLCEKANVTWTVPDELDWDAPFNMTSNTVNLNDLTPGEQVPITNKKLLVGNNRTTGSPSGSGLEFDNDFQDAKGPTVKFYQETFPHGETVRVGIEVFLRNLFTPLVFWVNDLRLPSQTTYDVAEVLGTLPAERQPIIEAQASVDGVLGLGGSNLPRWTVDAKLKALALVLPDIDLTEIADEIVGFRVVRADYDKEMIAQGFVLHGIDDRVTKAWADDNYWGGYAEAVGEDPPSPDTVSNISFLPNGTPKWDNGSVWNGNDTSGMFVSVEPCSHTEDGLVWNFPPGKTWIDGTDNWPGIGGIPPLNSKSLALFRDGAALFDPKNNPRWTYEEAFRRNLFLYSPDLDFLDEAVSLEDLDVEFIGELCEPDFIGRFFNPQGLWDASGTDPNNLPAYPAPSLFAQNIQDPLVAIDPAHRENLYPTRRNFFDDKNCIRAIVYVPVFKNPNPWERYRIRKIVEADYLQDGAVRQKQFDFPWPIFHGNAQSSGYHGFPKPETSDILTQRFGGPREAFVTTGLPSWSYNAAYSRKGKCVLIRLDTPHMPSRIGLDADWAGRNWQRISSNPLNSNGNERYMPALFRTDWPVDKASWSGQGADLQTLGGREGTGVDRIASNLFIVNLRRKIDKPYGGQSPDALAATRYRITSHFQPVDDRHPGNLGPNEYDATVFGGGAYITYYDRVIQYNAQFTGKEGSNFGRDNYTGVGARANDRRWYANPYFTYYWNNETDRQYNLKSFDEGRERNRQKPRRYQPMVTMVVPLLSWQNPLLRELRNEESETLFLRDQQVYNEMEESGVSETIDKRSEPFHLEPLWSNEPSLSRPLGQQPDKPCSDCYINLVRYSLRKNFGETDDSWVRFLPLNFSEAPIEHGAINGIGQIFPQGGSNINVWQERAVGQLPFLEDQIVTAKSGDQLGIGQATGMGTWRLTKANVGMQQTSPLYIYGNAAYWYDSATRRLYRYAQDGIIDLGASRGMRSFFDGQPSRQFTPLGAYIPNEISLADAPMSSRSGGYQTYLDPRYNELYVTASYRRETFEGLLNDGWNLTFNESLNVFQSFHSWIPDGFVLLDGNRTILLNNFNNGPYQRGIYLADSGGRNDYGRFFGSDSVDQTYVTFLFNPDLDVLKQPASVHVAGNEMWDRVEWASFPQALPFDQFVLETFREAAYFTARGTRWQSSVPRVKSAKRVVNNDPQRPDLVPTNLFGLGPLQGDLIKVTIRVSAQALRTLHAVYTEYGIQRRAR